MYKIITDDNVECAFPNLNTASHMFPTLMVTNCSAERSFFQQKYIKNSLKTSTEQSRSDSLSILSMEADLLRKITSIDIIKDFGVTRSRKNIQA